MPRTRGPLKPTHRAVLLTGETVDYGGAHPTHFTFGGVDEDGNRDGSKVRTVPVVSRIPLKSLPPTGPEADPEDVDEDEDDDDE